MQVHGKSLVGRNSEASHTGVGTAEKATTKSNSWFLRGGSDGEALKRHDAISRGEKIPGTGNVLDSWMPVDTVYPYMPPSLKDHSDWAKEKDSDNI
jgi:hypothetical protein